MFLNAYISRLPELDLRNVPSLESLIRSNRVETIDKIILNNEGDQAISVAFTSCSRLKNIEFDGVIGRAASFSVSPLSVKSTKSIITHLKNYAGTDSEYAYTVTFKASAFETLEAEGATSPNGNTWAEYIDDLKWNLTLA